MNKLDRLNSSARASVTANVLLQNTIWIGTDMLAVMFWEGPWELEGLAELAFGSHKPTLRVMLQL